VFTLTNKWAEQYADFLEMSNADQNTDALWEKLGDDGWEFVQAVEDRRDQFVETRTRKAGHNKTVELDTSYAQVFARATSGHYILKRRVEPD
jgi:hypothetical protein